MFSLAKYFEVRDLKSGTVQRMQYQAPIKPTLEAHRNLKTGTMQTIPFEAQCKLIKNPPVRFAHEGFAVAGAGNNDKVYVWDSERGDQLLTLNHGGKYPRLQNNTQSLTSPHRRFESMHSGGALCMALQKVALLTRPVAPLYRQHF